MSARPGSSRYPGAGAGRGSGLPGVLRAALHEVAYSLALMLAGASVLYVCVLLPSRLKTDRLREQRDALRTRKAQLEKDVEALRAGTTALEGDPWAVERALRRRLGFLRPGEHVLKGQS